MKKCFWGIIIIVFSLVCYLTYGSTNGTVKKVLDEGYIVYKYQIGKGMTNNESFSFNFTGMIYRIVIDANTIDPDGSFIMKDISEANYVDWKNVLNAKRKVDYTLECSSISGNVALGYPVAGTQRGILTNMAEAAPLTIWIYCSGAK